MTPINGKTGLRPFTLLIVLGILLPISLNAAFSVDYFHSFRGSLLYDTYSILGDDAMAVSANPALQTKDDVNFTLSFRQSALSATGYTAAVLCALRRPLFTISGRLGGGLSYFNSGNFDIVDLDDDGKYLDTTEVIGLNEFNAFLAYNEVLTDKLGEISMGFTLNFLVPVYVEEYAGVSAMVNVGLKDHITIIDEIFYLDIFFSFDNISRSKLTVNEEASVPYQTAKVGISPQIGRDNVVTFRPAFTTLFDMVYGDIVMSFSGILEIFVSDKASIEVMGGSRYGLGDEVIPISAGVFLNLPQVSFGAGVEYSELGELKVLAGVEIAREYKDRGKRVSRLTRREEQKKVYPDGTELAGFVKLRGVWRYLEGYDTYAEKYAAENAERFERFVRHKSEAERRAALRAFYKTPEGMAYMEQERARERAERESEMAKAREERERQRVLDAEARRKEEEQRRLDEQRRQAELIASEEAETIRAAEELSDEELQLEGWTAFFNQYQIDDFVINYMSENITQDDKVLDALKDLKGRVFSEKDELFAQVKSRAGDWAFTRRIQDALAIIGKMPKYRVDDAALKKMMNYPIPKDVIKALEPMKMRRYYSEKEFLEAAEATVGVSLWSTLDDAAKKFLVRGAVVENTMDDSDVDYSVVPPATTTPVAEAAETKPEPVVEEKPKQEGPVFKFTGEGIEMLKKAGLSDDVIARLKTIEGKEIIGEDAFKQTVVKTVGRLWTKVEGSMKANIAAVALGREIEIPEKIEEPVEEVVVEESAKEETAEKEEPVVSETEEVSKAATTKVYLINEESVSKLEEAGLEPAILDEIKMLVGKKYESEEALLKDIGTSLGDDIWTGVSAEVKKQIAKAFESVPVAEAEESASTEE